MFVRSNTAAAWTTTNPVLALDDVGQECDTGRMKVGDGSTTWNSLAYNYVTATFGNAAYDPMGAAAAVTKASIGLGSVDNTSDAGKPVSTAQQTALNLKANLASPTFTGTVGGVTKAMVGLGSADDTSDVGKPVSTAQQTALNLKANLADPALTGAVTTTGTLGYRTGAGGTVTQLTSKSTGVTLNKVCGSITMNNAALAAAAEVTFVVTNSTVAAADVVVVCMQAVGTPVAYFVSVGAVANGSFSITVGNVSAGSLSQAVVLNFAVIKSVAA